MKAAVIYENGGPEVLRYEDVADPECPDGCVVVDAEAISIEGGDLLARAGGDLPAVPHIVGYLSAGTISEVAAGVEGRAVGDRVVVRDGKHRWQADNGQYLLGLDVMQENGVLQMVEHRQMVSEASDVPEAKSAEQWFEEALRLEDADVRAARNAYEQAVKLDSQHVASWINWGRLLHEHGATGEAERVYRRAIDQCGQDPLLMFNHGVLLEDLGNTGAALRAYHAALEEDPDLADCHYNLARLYQALGQAQHAIRHFGQYRRLVTSN